MTCSLGVKFICVARAHLSAVRQKQKKKKKIKTPQRSRRYWLTVRSLVHMGIVLRQSHLMSDFR